MRFFYIEPEVAGGLGDGTLMDRNVYPPVVERLDYRFDGWLGDAIVESFPVFILTDEARDTLSELGATGADFGEVEVTLSDQFTDSHPSLTLPPFVWLKPTGTAGRDDIATVADSRLVISERALRALNRIGLAHASVDPFDD